MVEFVAVLQTHTDRVGRSLHFDSGGGAVAASEAFIRLSSTFQRFDRRALAEHGVDASSQLILGNGPAIRVPIGGDGEDPSAATANSLLRRSLTWPGVLQSDGTTRFPREDEQRYNGGESIPLVEFERFERVVEILRHHLSTGHERPSADPVRQTEVREAHAAHPGSARSSRGVGGISQDRAGRGRGSRRATPLAPPGWIWQPDARERYGVPQSTLNSWNDRGFFSEKTRVRDTDHAMIRFERSHLEHVLEQHGRLARPLRSNDH
ncbi:MAG: hypothetical protein L6Q99_07280 [Planctomycetes bacterium]|nr:hypothetical protein [Planctomycetota bacterium]